jgi:hypothetical protein
MSACVKCGQDFHCAMTDGAAGERCWCMELPPIPTVVLTEAGGRDDACFCPSCLKTIAQSDAGE